MSITSRPASSAGRTSGRVMRLITWNTDAPLMSPDSSTDGSVARKAANISRNTTGDRWSPSTMIIPGSENTSTLRNDNPTSSRATLTTPARLLSRKIHEMV